MANEPKRPTVASALEAGRAILTRPSSATFARLARAGRLEGGYFDASRYVALAAFLAAIVALPRGDTAMLGTFLSVLLGFATFAWFVHRLTAAGLGELAYLLALPWVPITVVASVLITVVTWLGVGDWLIPFVGIVSVAAGLSLAFLALRATVPGRPIAIAVVLLVSAGAAYGVNRLVWTLVGAS